MVRRMTRNLQDKTAVRAVGLALFGLLGAAIAAAQVSPTSMQQLQQQVQQMRGGIGAPVGAAGAASGMSNLHGAATVAPEDVSHLKLGPGSMIELHVFEEPDLDGSYRVDPQGNVALPLAGAIHLDTLTLREAEAAVRQKLIAEEILNNPHVVVNIDEYNAENIVILGEVNTPGRYPVIAERKLIDVLAMAGGETSLAGNEVVLHRNGQPDEVTETIHYSRGVNDPVSLSTVVHPGDTVLVKRAGIVYVLGEVNRPGGYIMQEAGDLNIAQAVALAYGTAPDAALGGIRILRKNPDGSMAEIRAQYNKFNNGKAYPLPLQPEDVVFVPSSKIKATFTSTKTLMGQVGAATIYAVK